MRIETLLKLCIATSYQSEAQEEAMISWLVETATVFVDGFGIK
jgi:hypothetical protein